MMGWWYESELPILGTSALNRYEDVAVYEVDQRPSACEDPWPGFCSGIHRLVRLLVDKDDGYDLGATTVAVGAWWRLGGNVRVEAVEGAGDRSLARVGPAE